MLLNSGISTQRPGPFLADFFGNNVDHPTERIGAVQGRHRAAHHFDTFDGIHRDPVKVEVVVAKDGVPRVDALAVNQDQCIAAAQTADADAFAVIPFVGELDPGHIAQYVFQVLDRLALQILLSDDADARRRVFDALFSRRGGHHQRFFIHVGQGRKRQRYDGRRQSRPDKRV